MYVCVCVSLIYKKQECGGLSLIWRHKEKPPSYLTTRSGDASKYTKSLIE